MSEVILIPGYRHTPGIYVFGLLNYSQEILFFLLKKDLFKKYI